MGVSLDSLPPELLYDIVLHIKPEDLKPSLLALSRAIPRSSVPTFLLFEKIRITRREQVFQLYRRLRDAPEDAARVREFAFESWTVDADIFVNLVGLMPSLTYFKLFVGPNFAPEHLEEIFEKPRPCLKYLSMRFRPYVQRATYYQFLKGAYFDSTLFALAKWPTPILPTLSIVQDPLDPTIAPTTFAQPLVFFRLDPLSALAVSPLANTLKHFRLRVPGRPIAAHLHVALHSYPALEFLDMSTSNVGRQDLAYLLGRMRHLQVLVLDGCPIVSQRTDIQADAGEPFLQWAELGEAMALSGLARASEREKKLHQWIEAYYLNDPDDEGDTGGKKGKKSKRGRRGLATATISLRQKSPERTVEVTRDLPAARVPKRHQRIRILPPVPSLRSLATSFPGGTLTPDTYEAVRDEFERGWAEGIARLQKVRLRHWTSWQNGITRIVRFADHGSPEWLEEERYGEQGLVGLVDVLDESEFMLNVAVNEDAALLGQDCPQLCIAGPSRDANHVQRCGHQIGWDLYKDEI
ncbi:hypothetical protein FKP32DRAFT_1584592 [Trametes sanguinea]|nr:hypothetical protein FKP32DRAFT_1584592 [Trametes sanguinea]